MVYNSTFENTTGNLGTVFNMSFTDYGIKTMKVIRNSTFKNI